MKGSVQKLGGTWRYAIYLGVENGKKKYLLKGGFQTQHEAQESMCEVLNSIDDGSTIRPTQMTLGEYLAKWLQDMSTVVRYSTMRQWNWAVNDRIIPALGHIPLQSLTTHHVQSFYGALKTSARALSSRSMWRVHRILNVALNRAVTLGYVAENVAAKVETPAAKKL